MDLLHGDSFAFVVFFQRCSLVRLLKLRLHWILLYVLASQITQQRQHENKKDLNFYNFMEFRPKRWFWRWVCQIFLWILSKIAMQCQSKHSHNDSVVIFIFASINFLVSLHTRKSPFNDISFGFGIEEGSYNTERDIFLFRRPESQLFLQQNQKNGNRTKIKRDKSWNFR